MKNINELNDLHFDQLMDQIFLDLDFGRRENAGILEGTASEVMLMDRYKVSSENKTAFQKAAKIILVPAVLILIAIACYHLNKDSDQSAQVIKEKKMTEIPSGTSPDQTAKPEIFLKSSSQPGAGKENPEQENRIVVSLLPDSSLKEADQPLVKNEEVFKDTAIVKSLIVDSAYVFPTLTEKEIKANNKQKKRMIEQLYKFSKAKYAAIPTGTFHYNSEKISLYGFYMSTSEVTNLEYRTFLFDLLIKGEKDKFLKAKPDQQQWLKEFNNRPYFQPMADNYFSHPAYNEYPVVNVSRDGAEMYCMWLTTETNKVLTEKNKPLINDVRIPTDAEWTYAAEGGKENAVYPWAHDAIRSPKAGCFMANFCLKKYSGRLDSIEKCNPKAFVNAYTTGGLMLGEGTCTVMAYAYNPNNYGLYCMSGNVAEMVNVPEMKQYEIHIPGTKGGGWNSSDANLKIHGKDEYEGKKEPSVFIGFRPVISANKIK